MTDQQFPGRPDHPDFWLISQALIDTDAQADSGQTIPDIAGRIVDTESLMYAATQRAMRGLVALHGRMTLAESERNKAVLAATWMDAFVAGARYQHLKSSGAQQAPDSLAQEVINDATNYRQREIDDALKDAEDADTVRTKFIGPHGESKWLSVPAKLVRQMREILGEIEE